MTIPIVAVMAVAIVLAVIVASTSRRADPIVRRYMTYASHRGWSRVPADQTKTRLEPFGEYLGAGASIRVAIAGPLGSGRGMAAVVEQREGGRTWYVAVADSEALHEAPPVRMDPRAVRTVRVMDVREVQVDESRIARGWRVTSPEHDAAEAWLHMGRRAVELSDVLHRPHPWVFAIRVRPGSVAIHLVRREEHVADVDDLSRMVTLVGDLARALDVTPVGGPGAAPE